MTLSALEVWLWLTAALFALGALRTLIAHARVPALPALAPQPDEHHPAAPPRVAVVVAARNEVDRVAPLIRALANQQGVDLRAVIVDDRSTDFTSDAARAAINESAAADRIRVIRVDALPEGWLGKCHALHVGARDATRDFDADWLLFMDADCALTPGAIARALAAADRDRADHLCIIPRLESRSFLGQSCLLALMIPLMRRCAAVNANSPRASMGVGAFNLIRRNLYESFAGHEPLRLEVLDDVYLGALVQRAGGRTRIYFAPDAASVDYAATIPDVFRDLRKNAFAALRFNAPAALALLLLLSLLWLTGVAGFLTFTPAGFAATAAFLTPIIPAAVGARRLGWSFAPAFATPFVLIIPILAFAASVAVTLRAGGVRWRDTFYPLKTLKAGMIPPAGARKQPAYSAGSKPPRITTPSSDT